MALKWHEKYRIDRIYTCQEELVIRAAGLRKLLGLSNRVGLYPEDALAFRDKGVMKQICQTKGLPIPKFSIVNTPSDVISFIHENGYPIVLKPTLSCASVGVIVIKNQEELEHYLEKEFCISFMLY